MTDYTFKFDVSNKQWLNKLDHFTYKPLDQTQLPEYCKLENKKIKCQTVVTSAYGIDNNIAINTPEDNFIAYDAIFGFEAVFATITEGYANKRGATGNKQIIGFEGFDRTCEIEFDNILPVVTVFCKKLPKSLETALNVSKRLGMS